MAATDLFEDIGGFLFNPTGILVARSQEHATRKYVNAFLSLVGISAAQGIAAFFMIFYPEPLYYGLGPGTPHAHLYVIEQSNPLLLAGLVILLVIINIVYFHLVLGGINHVIMKRMAPKGETVATFRASMTVNGYSFLPLLFTLPLAAFRIFFLGRIAFNNHDFPFFDMTVPNILYLVILGVFYAWMFVIQAKTNQILFLASRWRAAIPTVITAIITVVILCVFAIILPSLLNAVVYTIINE